MSLYQPCRILSRRGVRGNEIMFKNGHLSENNGMDKELRKVSHGKNSYWVKKINFYQFSTSFPFDAQQRGYSEKAMAPHSSTLA